MHVLIKLKMYIFKDLLFFQKKIAVFIWNAFQSIKEVKNLLKFNKEMNRQSLQNL